MIRKHVARRTCATPELPTALKTVISTINYTLVFHAARKLYTRVILLDANRLTMGLPSIAVTSQCVVVCQCRNRVVLLDELHREAFRRVPTCYSISNADNARRFWTYRCDSASTKRQDYSSQMPTPSTQMREAWQYHDGGDCLG